jgi:hypothetical protein
MGGDFLLKRTIGLLEECELKRDQLFELEYRSVAVDPDLEALAVLAALFERIDNV